MSWLLELSLVLFPICQYRSTPLLSSCGAGTSTVREADGFPVANNSPPLDGFIVENCSDDEDLEE
jgi:hypothetical protein